MEGKGRYSLVVRQKDWTVFGVDDGQDLVVAENLWELLRPCQP